jgi:hypothetical protein
VTAVAEGVPVAWRGWWTNRQQSALSFRDQIGGSHLLQTTAGRAHQQLLLLIRSAKNSFSSETYESEPVSERNGSKDLYQNGNCRQL